MIHHLTALLTMVLARFRHRKVPVVLQLQATECGAACLAMILGAWGRHVRLADLRDAMGPGRNGVTATHIIKAATDEGLRMQAFSIDLDRFHQVPLPAIAHWDFEHFVVVERWRKDRVTIVDPGRGRQTLPIEDFSNHYTGIVLPAEPGPEFQRLAKGAPSWHRYVWSMLAHAPGLLVRIVLASLLLQLLGLALPVLTKIVVDNVLGQEMHDLLPIVAIGALIVVLGQCVSGLLRGMLLISLQARVDQQLMSGFFRHLLTLPYAFFERRTSGDLMMRLASNAQVREILTGQTLSVFIDGSLVVVYVAVLLAKAPAFGAVVLGIGLVQLAILWLSRRTMHEHTQQDLGAQTAAQAYLVEALHGVATIKASGTEGRVLTHWDTLFGKQLAASVRRSVLGTFVDTLVGASRLIAPLLLIWIGAGAVIDGRMSLGTMLALQALAASALQPLSSLVANGQRLQLVGAHLDRLSDVLETDPEETDGTAISITGEIVVDRVSFRYDEHGPAVLHNLSLTIQPGEKVGVVGRTGSGKSTLLQLLLGLRRPSEGDIRIDGTSLNDLDLHALRRQVGVVLQDPVVFSGSIFQNLTFNDPDLTLDQVIQAAQAAELHDEIMAMPMGYDTWLAEGGSGLSGGQRQRLALARALVHQPRLLLLDEATSALDVGTEAAIERNLRSLRCTRVVIAHRLSTILDADQIVHLENGRIVEMGNPAKLQATNGPFATLVHHETHEAANTRAVAAD